MRLGQRKRTWKESFIAADRRCSAARRGLRGARSPTLTPAARGAAQHTRQQTTSQEKLDRLLACHARSSLGGKHQTSAEMRAFASSCAIAVCRRALLSCLLLWHAPILLLRPKPISAPPPHRSSCPRHSSLEWLQSWGISCFTAYFDRGDVLSSRAAVSKYLIHHLVRSFFPFGCPFVFAALSFIE